ncbi:hypothetical protein ACQR3W_21800 [Rhodococcus ruber]|uniref:Uncharacterized protein n=1 Tax=Rhodococcus ruber TaxID=1830 RepID=A0A098BJX2_9NOCA|nr:hypothetical protein [Rhodococcus ruber]MCZ4533349.1 hypothetical protein [Rhodococcus ruber]MCZ4533400.1 hypothetical protein [Rhodococcus ruber]CDZ88993.1 conserved hypothetical protein [Rhodococcus ruber]
MNLYRAFRGRVWVYRGWRFHGVRHNLLPWMSGDEYMRRTLVLPVGFGAVIIALWLDIDEWNFADRTWARWYRLHRAGVRLSYR